MLKCSPNYSHPILAICAIIGLLALTGIAHVGTDATTQSTTSTSAISVTAGQAPTLNDAVIVHIVVGGKTNDTISGPAGYTCSNANGGSDSFAECYHIARSGETSALGTFTLSASGAYCYMTAEFSGVNATTPVASSAGAAYNASSSAVTASYPAPSGGAVKIVGMAFNAATVATATITGWTIDRNASNAGGECPTVSSFESPMLSAGGSYTVAYSNGVASTGTSFIELSPACPATLLTLYLGCP